MRQRYVSIDGEWVPINEAAIDEQIRLRFPQLAYLRSNPEINELLIKAIQGTWSQTELEPQLYNTEWWRSTSESVRLWDAKFHVDPAQANAEWDQKTLAVGNQARRMGVTLNEFDTKWVAGKVLREGWTDDQLNSFLGSLARNTGSAAPGAITETQATLKAAARKYMVGMDDATLFDFAVRIAEGSATREAVDTLLRDQAKARFHWLAPQIDAGFSPTDLFASTRQAVATQLEIDPNQIDLNDPRWSQLTAPIQDGNTMRSMTFTEAQQWARSRPEWRVTNNANAEASELGLNILRSMGVLAS